MKETLRSTVAEFLGVDPQSVVPTLPLAGKRLEGSLGRARLDAAIRRRTGLKARNIQTARTYGELEAALFPDDRTDAPADQETPAPKPAPRQGAVDPPHLAAPESSAGCSCGIDLEPFDSFPIVADYFEHEFYKSHFTSEEIAYCVLQPNPIAHFAGRWCAKEALKKCDASLLTEEFNCLEVSIAADGRPMLRRMTSAGVASLPHALSISHAGALAVAIVICDAPQTPGPALDRTMPVAHESAAVKPVENRQNASILAGLALILAIAALAWEVASSFGHH